MLEQTRKDSSSQLSYVSLALSMLIYDKSEQLTLYIWDRAAVIGGVEADKMIEECGNAGLVSSYFPIYKKLHHKRSL
ncbi:hypothetical protein NC653_038290 [Populus alba x Populus x berolinensis]|uniref:Uncharacterized protein n=1 Tax=Populus alba x Populus x berolinensis TaxID=444605 RepID=A0AAD6PT13_9ROSI|nr:hypothetical protein NC653_038290 [Populus alba x Populus x berolinensis]